MEARALQDTTEAQELRVQALIVHLEAKDSMEDLVHMGQEASLVLMITVSMEDLAHMEQEASLDLMVIALMEDLVHMGQEASLDLMVTILMEDLA